MSAPRSTQLTKISNDKNSTSDKFALTFMFLGPPATFSSSYVPRHARNPEVLHAVFHFESTAFLSMCTASPSSHIISIVPV